MTPGSTLAAEAASSAAGRSTRSVVTCYSVLDKFLPKCGFFDLSEGIYKGDAGTPFDEAQLNQHDYLLDQIRCGPGSRILEVGCGYGTVLDRVRERGARGVGITLSPVQARHCRERGLDVRLINYKALGKEWDAGFDGVIANGSMEHFVQPMDAAEGRADAIYRNFFATIHRVLDPRSPTRRFANTTLHFVRRPDPKDLLRNPFFFPKGSDRFHYGLLARSFGGWYPELGQFQRGAEGLFNLAEEVDGTEDCRLTSEEWLARVRRTLRSRKGTKIAFSCAPTLLRHPVQFPTMLICMLVSESWTWQFRPPNPPTRLLRQTWERRD